MFFTLAQIIQWVIAHKYFVLFPIMVIEGPIITVIAGFLVSLNQLNIFIVGLLAIMANLVSDSILYFIGRWGRGWWKIFGLTPARVANVEEHFKKHTIKTLLVGKMALGIGNIPLVAAGVARMPYLKYFGINFLIEVPKALIFLLVGFYFGQAYDLIDQYLQLATIFLVVGSILLIVFYWFLKIRLAKYYQKL